jgi:hypothetical protein
MIYNRFNAWGQKRELPAFPKQSFRELYRQRSSETNGDAATTDFTDGADKKGTRA